MFFYKISRQIILIYVIIIFSTFTSEFCIIGIPSFNKIKSYNIFLHFISGLFVVKCKQNVLSKIFISVFFQCIFICCIWIRKTFSNIMSAPDISVPNIWIFCFVYTYINLSINKAYNTIYYSFHKLFSISTSKMCTLSKLVFELYTGLPHPAYLICVLAADCPIQLIFKHSHLLLLIVL